MIIQRLTLADPSEGGISLDLIDKVWTCPGCAAQLTSAGLHGTSAESVIEHPDDCPEIASLSRPAVAAYRKRTAAVLEAVAERRSDAEFEKRLEAIRDRRPLHDALETAPAEPQKPCAGFRWIGQSFAQCDRCGLPYWDHDHEERLNPDAGPFSLQAMELVPITPESAEACRRKWGPR